MLNNFRGRSPRLKFFIILCFPAILWMKLIYRIFPYPYTVIYGVGPDNNKISSAFEAPRIY